MALTFGSLFAGVGGFDMGFEQAGWDCKFQVEWDKNCRTILDKHWPDVEKWGDIRNVDGRFLPPVDCIIFGSPCQDLSLAGARKGLSGERSGLFHEAVRIIKEMRNATNGTHPRWTVWENVAGALSSNNGRDFGTVINEMAKAGAHLQEYAVLDAQHFGIPQRRRRVFLASCFDSATAEYCPDPLLPVRESLPGDTKKGRTKGQNTADETPASTEEHFYLAFDTQFGSNANVFKDQIPTLKATQQPPSIAYDEYNNSISEIHHFLRAGTKQSTGVLESTMKVRRLTPIECERLMGWPDDHTKHKADGTEQADVHRYRQCGNGVATPVARWVAEQIAKVEHGKG
jgi:DNA (cytosine-5)-methyltransferase 1